ncbi:polysaccharide lyase 6 family protein [Cerasicoccus fimbriatus]|uniref:polysaccharide lyase 6 family protein n=1 Tax=Cerasicoccus fimbriatus TaxID=3014554 RepID=UPI0022B45784|nr:polysaccharide lyase 6 family protein [Cerasicoccus sp. TK19100]
MKKIFAVLVFGAAFSGLTAAQHRVTSASEVTALIQSGVVVAGDELIWANGEYADVAIRLTGVDGEPGAPITLRAETAGQVVFTGSSHLQVGSDYAVVSGFRFLAECDEGAAKHVIEFRSGSDDAHHSRLTNVVIEEREAGPPVLKKSKWVVLFGQFNRVDHCHFSGKRTHDNLMTVYLDETDAKRPAYHQIDHNYFGDRADGELAGGTNNGWEIIRIGDSRTSQQLALCRVEHNYFERCDGEIEIISNKSGGNIYQGNGFVECAGQLTLRHGFGCLVVDNLFVGSPSGNSLQSGVRIIGPDHQVVGNTFWRLGGEGARGAIVLTEGVADGQLNEYLPVTNALVRGNVIIDCHSPFVIGAMYGRKAKGGKVNDVPPRDVVIEHNSVIGNAPVFEFLSGGKPLIFLSNNLAFTDHPVAVPWAASADAFTVQLLDAAMVDKNAIQNRVEFIRQNSGPQWRK